MFSWMKKPNSGIWNPLKGDNFTLDDLKDYKIFYEDDLHKAKLDLERWLVFTQKHPRLTQSKRGVINMIQICKRAIYEAEINLKTVNRLISEFK